MMSTMPTPQTGIFALGTMSHVYLELDLVPGAAPGVLVGAVAGLREPRTTIGGVNLVVGFRPELWASVAPDDTPTGVTSFRSPVSGPTGVTMPATQHDAVIWIAGGEYDAVFDVTRAVRLALAPWATLVHEIVGWPYHHDLDLTGFIDGTENPSLVEAASVAIVPAGGPGAGSSILLLQQWRHDGLAWDALPQAQQEAVIGRTRSDSVELDPRPAGSHVARTDQEAFGHILRRNVAWGTLLDHGTIFSGFAANQAILARMLDSMAGIPDGIVDELTRFAAAVTGAYYVVPSVESLSGFPSPAPDLG
jgi:putative iron-dependent peroxidase